MPDEPRKSSQVKKVVDEIVDCIDEEPEMEPDQADTTPFGFPEGDFR